MKKARKLLKLPALAMLCFGIALPLASLADGGTAGAANLKGMTDAADENNSADNHYYGGITVSAPTAFDCADGGDREGAQPYAYAGSFDLASGGSTVGDSGLTTAAAWKFEVPPADGKTYYALADGAYKEYATSVDKETLF